MKAHEYGNPLARTVLIQPVDEQDLSLIENEVEQAEKPLELLNGNNTKTAESLDI